MVFDVDGCTLLGFRTSDSGDMLNYVAGPRLSLPTGKRWIAQAQVLIGDAKVTHVHVNVGTKNWMDQVAAQTGQSAPEQDQYTSEVDTNGFTLLAGGELSRQINELLVLRVADLAYQHSWVSTLQGSSYAQGLRFGCGLGFRFGRWRERLHENQAD